MPIFIAALLGGLVQVAGSLAGRVLLSLGFAAVSYTGLSASLTFLKAQALTQLGGLPVNAVSLLAYMKVGESISVITSALVVRMVLNGLSAGGSISKLVKR